MVSIRKFRIIELVSNRIEYWSNYSIRFEISTIRTALVALRFSSRLTFVLPPTFCTFRVLEHYCFEVATHMENLGNLRVVREKSGKIGKVFEWLYNRPRARTHFPRLFLFSPDFSPTTLKFPDFSRFWRTFHTGKVLEFSVGKVCEPWSHFE